MIKISDCPKSGLERRIIKRPLRLGDTDITLECMIGYFNKVTGEHIETMGIKDHLIPMAATQKTYIDPKNPLVPWSPEKIQEYKDLMVAIAFHPTAVKNYEAALVEWEKLDERIKRDTVKPTPPVEPASPAITPITEFEFLNSKLKEEVVIEDEVLKYIHAKDMVGFFNK